MKILLCFLAVLMSGRLHADSIDLYTNVYVVPPTFFTTDPQHDGWNPETDPFRDLKPKTPRPTAKEILGKAGVTFGPGTSAVYNAAKSQIIVRNTQDQMELVEAYIDSVVGVVEKQIYIVIREILIPGELDSLSLDEMEKPVVELLEGIQNRIETAASRSPAEVTRFGSYEAFREHLSTDPTKLREHDHDSVQFTAKPLTDPKFQLLAHELKKHEAVKMLSPPSVMSRSGEPFVVTSGERRYGISGVLGPDEFTIDLNLFLPPPGKALPPDSGKFDTPFQARIFDQEHAMFVSHSAQSNHTRLVFIKTSIMDPAGIPINEKGGRSAKEAAENKNTSSAETTPDISQENVELVKQSDNHAARGSWYLSNGKPVEAALYFNEALKVLPKLDVTNERRAAYEKQLAHAKATEPLEPKKVSLMKEKLESIIIPSIDFRDQPLDECFAGWFEHVIKEKDASLFPDIAPKLVFDESIPATESAITLRLSNVPASEALRYLCRLTQLRYEIDGGTIRLLPLQSK